MYFQNPPTNFIDKFVLIINPLQINVNFFLGHQCKILRLYRADAIVGFVLKTSRGKDSELLFLLYLHNVGFGSAVPKT